MKPWKDDIACFMLEERLDKYGVITVEKSFYSVPDSLVGKTVHVRIYITRSKSSTMVIVAEHDKTGRGEWHILLEHYLHTLLQPEKALKNARKRSDRRRGHQKSLWMLPQRPL